MKDWGPGEESGGLVTGPRAWRRRESSQGQQSLFLDLNEKTGVAGSHFPAASRWQRELGLVLWAPAHTSGPETVWVLGGAQRHLASARKVCPGVKGPAHLHSLLSESFSQRLPAGAPPTRATSPARGSSYLCTLDSLFGLPVRVTGDGGRTTKSGTPGSKSNGRKHPLAHPRPCRE